VDDEAHVALVDAHAEGHGGDDDVALVAGEGVLVAVPHLVGEPGVVGQRAHAVFAEPGGERVHRAAREAVDDAALAGVVAHDAEDVAP
jgi:hypothetical protein